MEMQLPSTMTSRRVYPLHIVSQIDPYGLILDFSAMSNAEFKHLLLTKTSIPNEYLFIDDNVTYVRQLFNLTAKAEYFLLQHDQWQHYYLFGRNTGVWCGFVSKTMAEANSMPYTYGRQKLFIEHRRKYFETQLLKTTEQLEQHTDSWNSNMDIKRLLDITDHFIDKDQRQLRVEMTRRQRVLVYDYEDHQLVRSFYKLKPRNSEVCATYQREYIHNC